MRMSTLPTPAPLTGLALRCQSDSRLAALSREGQTRAFEEIVRRYRERLVSFVAAIVPAHRAEDVVQEALAKAHTSLVRSDAEIKLKPWLYTIVRNRALNALRDEPTHEHLDESFDGVAQPPEVAAQARAVDGADRATEGPAGRPARCTRPARARGPRSPMRSRPRSERPPGAVRALIYRARTALRDGAGDADPDAGASRIAERGPPPDRVGGHGNGRRGRGTDRRRGRRNRRQGRHHTGDRRACRGLGRGDQQPRRQRQPIAATAFAGTGQGADSQGGRRIGVLRRIRPRLGLRL